MRMTKRFEDEARPFEPARPRQSGHIGPGPKPGPKRAVNVSVDAEILKLAKEMKINLSQALEETLRRRVRDEQDRRWADENRAVIDSYNRLIERAGVFGEELLDLDEEFLEPDDDAAV